MSDSRYGVRTDCTRDNKETKLPNADTLGFGLWKAKRGNWIVYEQDNHKTIARVIGRVHCEGKTYIEVVALSEDLTFGFVRWIEPAQVRRCIAKPPRAAVAFLLGDDWQDPDTILKTIHQGFYRAADDDALLASTK